MARELAGRRVAILVDHGFEQVELQEPRKALEAAGAVVHVVSPVEGKVTGWDFTDWGEEVAVDVPLSEADPDEYDALVLPGGVMNPDHLRRRPEAWRFVRAFFASNRPVAAICHAPWTLIDAGVVKGRRLTSYHTLQSDLRNAGAEWVDEEVVVDGNLTTSRKPDDLPAFHRTIVEQFARAQPAAGR